MEHEIYPTEQEYMRQCHEMGAAPSNEWTHAPILIDLMHKAKSLGLWNMFLPIDSARAAGDKIGRLGYGLTNRQYAEICEILGMLARRVRCPSHQLRQSRHWEHGGISI